MIRLAVFLFVMALTGSALAASMLTLLNAGGPSVSCGVLWLDWSNACNSISIVEVP